MIFFQRHELIDDSTSLVTIRRPMLLTHINGPSTSTQAICISRLAYSFYVTTVNLQVCLISRTPQYRKTCILNNTRTLALAHLPVHNGVFQRALLLCFMDQAQHKMALHPTGVDAWQIFPTRSLRLSLSLSLSLSLRLNLPACTIRASPLDRPHHKGKAVRVRIKFGNTKSSTDTLQYDELHHHPIQTTMPHSRIQPPSLCHSPNYLYLDQPLLIVYLTQTMELQTLA